jgi:hypothetical protein
MKKNKVTYIDQTSEKNHHMVFNASMITILNNVYSPDNIHYFGVQSNQVATNSILTPELVKKVVLHEIKYPKSPSNKAAKTIVFFYKEIIRFFSFFKILMNAKSNEVVILSVTTVTSFFLFRLLKLIFRVPTFAVLHGDVDFLYNATNAMERFNAFLHKNMFKFKQASFKFIVINKISKNRMIQDSLLVESQIIEINHSFTLSNPEIFEKNNFQFDTINIGHIGSMEVERKNSHLLYDLATHFSKEVINKKIEFATIGLITPNILKFKNDLVVEKTGNSRPDKPDYLDRAEYEAYCSKLHFTIFFYDKNQYVFRTSGAVIDTIAMKIPVIGFKHPFFDYLEKEVGPIGYFFEDLNDLKTNLPQLLEDKEGLSTAYHQFKENLNDANRLFSLQYISDDFKNQISHT